MNKIQPTPSAERVHIAFVGRCNSGKSSLINALAGERVSVVSAVAGTTTDPVRKAIELEGLGASLLIDTAGLDDSSQLGELRVERSRRTLGEADIVVLLFWGEDISLERGVLEDIRRQGVKFIAVVPKSDCFPSEESLRSYCAEVERVAGQPPIALSATTGEGVDALRRAFAASGGVEERLLTAGLCKAGDSVLLVMPQDKQAPKGRLIMPQVQTLRELLDRGCSAMCCSLEMLPSALESLKRAPDLIITDSQIFGEVYRLKPDESRLTSFSILFARYKGDAVAFVEGAKVMLSLGEEAHILIAEACSHTPQNEDIGRVKLPRMLRSKLGEGLRITTVGGRDFPEDLTPYDLVIHCGACMFNRRLVMSRLSEATSQRVPMTNYGIAIAALSGILDRVEI